MLGTRGGLASREERKGGRISRPRTSPICARLSVCWTLASNSLDTPCISPPSTSLLLSTLRHPVGYLRSTVNTCTNPTAHTSRARSIHQLEMVPPWSLVVPIRNQVRHPRRPYRQNRRPRHKGRLGPYIRSQNRKLGVATIRPSRYALHAPFGCTGRYVHYNMYDPSSGSTSRGLLAWNGLAPGSVCNCEHERTCPSWKSSGAVCWTWTAGRDEECRCRRWVECVEWW